jgi:hypothetical protein
LAGELKAQGHQVSPTLVGELLEGLAYSLQGNRKTKEGSSHPDRDAQFRYINDQVAEALAAQQPVISVDTKKKELVGDFKNAGREWRPKGTPEEVRVHDFLIKELGRAVPYGVYDIAKPLVSYEVIIQLISATTTRTGLTVHCELDQNRYPKGIVVSDAEMATLYITRADFHGDWNYTISAAQNRALVL